jgi:hypothetical protein
MKTNTYDDYLQWYVLPADMKKSLGIKTEKEFSQHHDISRKQLWVWKNKPNFRKDIHSALRNMAVKDQVEIYHSLFNQSTKNPKIFDLWKDLFLS